MRLQPRLGWKETRRLISRDMDMYSELPKAFGHFPKDGARWRLFWYLLFTVDTFPPVLIYRIQIWLYDRDWTALATFLKRLNHTLYGITIGHNVRTTGALMLAHGHIVMDAIITLGDWVVVAPFVTLGINNNKGADFDLRGPTIGNRANIGTGAKVLGPVHIGDYAKIGANAVVVSDVPAYHTAVGAPARCFLSSDYRDGPPLSPEQA